MRPIERLLERSQNYETSRKLIGASQEMSLLMSRVVQPDAGTVLLDFGCGNGRLVPYSGGCTYIGVDNNSSYIDDARAKFSGNNIRFECADVESLADLGIPPVDIVVSIGVIHHLSDPQAKSALSAAFKLLRTGGRMITMDPCFEPNQRSIARVLMALDRGKYVRHPEGYLSILNTIVPSTEHHIWTDVYRFPYSHFVTESVRR